MWSVTVVGTPAPKGSMVPFIDKRTGRARLKEDAPAALKGWRKIVGLGGGQLRTRSADALRDVPVVVEATVTLARPASVTAAKRPWPFLKSPKHGDVDKLARTLLDALQDSHLFTDDAQVCRLVITKCYPDTPGVPDALPQPGAVIRVGSLLPEPEEALL